MPPLRTKHFSLIRIKIRRIYWQLLDSFPRGRKIPRSKSFYRILVTLYPTPFFSRGSHPSIRGKEAGNAYRLNLDVADSDTSPLAKIRIDPWPTPRWQQASLFRRICHDPPPPCEKSDLYSNTGRGSGPMGRG